MSFTGNSALSGFAEGFANVFGEQQFEKRRMEHQFSTEMFKTMLDNPAYANTDAGKRVLKSFGPQGEDAAQMFLEATANAKQNPIIAKILGGGMGGGEPQRTDEPLTGGADPNAMPMYAPTPGVPTTGTGEVALPTGQRLNVNFGQMAEGDKLRVASQLKTAWGQRLALERQQGGLPPLDPDQADLEATRATVHTIEQRVGADAVPEGYRKLMDAHVQAHTKALDALGIAGSPAAMDVKRRGAQATAQGRTAGTPERRAKAAGAKATRFTASDMKNYEYVDPTTGKASPISPGDTVEGAKAAGKQIRQKGSSGPLAAINPWATEPGTAAPVGALGGTGVAPPTPGAGSIYDADRINKLKADLGIGG